MFPDGDPGASGDRTFAGVRGGVTLPLGDRRGRFELGIWGYFERDFMQAEVTYSYTSKSSDLFGPSTSTTTTRSRTVGFARGGIAVSLGALWDL